MQIFKLVPRNLQHKDWRNSLWQEKVVVRAPSEQTAREVASHAFTVKVPFIPGVPLPRDPWRQEVLVEAKAIERGKVGEPDWLAGGRVQILDPVGYNGALEGRSWE